MIGLSGGYGDLCVKSVSVIICVLLFAVVLCAAGTACADQQKPTIHTRDELVQFLRECAEECRESIAFDYTDALKDKVSDRDWMSAVSCEGGIQSMSWNYNGQSATFSKISYYPEYYEQKRTGKQAVFRFHTLSEVEAHLKTVLSRRVSSCVFFYDQAKGKFESINELYRALKRNGVQSHKVSYLPDVGRVEITNITYYEHFAYLFTAEDIKAYMGVCTRELRSSIVFMCPMSLFEQVKADEFSWLASVGYNLGIFDRSFSYQSDYGCFFFENILYYPGMRIATAHAQGTLDVLTANEKQLLQKAQSIVSDARARSSTAFVLEKNLHDALCERVTYYTGDDSLGTFNTALGALLNGRADCDGYSDAFYLLASLAGFQVRYQYGSTIEGTDDSRHMWNLIKMNQKWYAVDVTWDDINNSDMREGFSHYIWLNAGRAKLSLTHFWNEDASGATLANDENPDCYYYTSDAFGGAAFDHVSDAAKFIVAEGRAGKPTVRCMIRGGAGASGALTDAIRKESFTGLSSSFYGKSLGSDLYIALIWTKVPSSRVPDRR